MRKFIVIILAFFLLSAGCRAFADQEQQIVTFKDGSQIKGVVAKMENGVYTVKTPVIGDVQVNAADVTSITSNKAPATTNAAASAPTTQSVNLDQQMAVMQKQLLSNPQSMAVLEEMAQNPEIVHALQDPAVVQAVTSHDYAAVANNPAIQKIINDPQMQALLQKLASTQQGQQQQ